MRGGAGCCAVTAIASVPTANNAPKAILLFIPASRRRSIAEIGCLQKPQKFSGAQGAEGAANGPFRHDSQLAKFGPAKFTFFAMPQPTPCTQMLTPGKVVEMG